MVNLFASKNLDHGLVKNKKLLTTEHTEYTEICLATKDFVF
jgi:hypothetical protein